MVGMNKVLFSSLLAAGVVSILGALLFLNLWSHAPAATKTAAPEPEGLALAPSGELKVLAEQIARLAGRLQAAEEKLAALGSRRSGESPAKKTGEH